MSYHHGDLRRALLAAALDRLDNHGCEAVTIRSVARDVGVSHAAPANHFKDRRALLTALAAKIYEGLGEEIERNLSCDPAPSRAERFPIFIDSFYRLGFEHPSRYELLWRRDLVDHNAPELAAIMDKIFERMLLELREATGSRREEEDIRIAATAAWSMTHGYVLMLRQGAFGKSRETGDTKRRFDTMLKILMAGLAAPEEPAPDAAPRRRKK